MILCGQGLHHCLCTSLCFHKISEIKDLKTNSICHSTAYFSPGTWQLLTVEVNKVTFWLHLHTEYLTFWQCCLPIFHGFVLEKLVRIWTNNVLLKWTQGFLVLFEIKCHCIFPWSLHINTVGLKIIILDILTNSLNNYFSPSACVGISIMDVIVTKVFLHEANIFTL